MKGCIISCVLKGAILHSREHLPFELHYDMSFCNTNYNCISLLTCIFSMFPLLLQYDVVPIQPSVVICSRSHPSMVRNQPDSCSPLAIPGASSSHCPGMEGSASEARAVGASASSQSADLRTQPAAQASQPRKKKPEDFRFGKILGEGSFSTVCNLHCTRTLHVRGYCSMLALFRLLYLDDTSSFHLRGIDKTSCKIQFFDPQVVLAREQLTGKEYASKWQWALRWTMPRTLLTEMEKLLGLFWRFYPEVVFSLRQLRF